MSYNTMSHVGLEADYYVTPEMLKAESAKWHYGFSWKGPEPPGTTLHAANGVVLVNAPCVCPRAECGLLLYTEAECYTHKDNKIAAAKQLHKAVDCPGA